MAYTKKEIAEIDKEQDYWEAVTKHIGWVLTGWDRYSHASYRNPQTGASQQIMGSFRDAIVKAMGGTGR